MSVNLLRRLLLFLFFLSGGAALIYEVVWMRAMSLVLGSTVYALSTMLATFMAGLAIGALIGGRIADGKKNLVLYFGLAELCIGVFGLISVPLIYSLPPVYFGLYHRLHLNQYVFFAAQFLMCSAIMIVPTTLMGVTFPLVSRAITETAGEMGKRVGGAYFSNTLGAIIGSLAAGFVLIPAFGIKNSAMAAAALNLIAGLASVSFSVKGAKWKVLAPALFLYALAGAAAWNSELRHHFSTFYMADRFSDFESLKKEEGKYETVFSGDYAQGYVRAYMNDGFLILQNGGKMEGTGGEDAANTIFLATLPSAALGRQPENVLVIGLGAGVTVWAGKQVSRNVEVAEINPGVVEAVSMFGIPGTLHNVGVHLRDARQHLFYNGKKYDIITSEPSVPTESVAANLFTKEFYEIAGRRLKEGGIFCQWFPAWALTKNDSRKCVKTFASVFGHVYLWRVGLDYIMVGSKAPFPFAPEEVLSRALGYNILPPAMAQIPEEGRKMLFEIELVRDSEGVKEIAAMPDVTVFTDDRPDIEFAVASNMLFGKGFRQYRK